MQERTHRMLDTSKQVEKEAIHGLEMYFKTKLKEVLSSSIILTQSKFDSKGFEGSLIIELCPVGFNYKIRVKVESGRGIPNLVNILELEERITLEYNDFGGDWLSAYYSVQDAGVAIARNQLFINERISRLIEKESENGR